jgi:tRNA1Val (adenine37-N6)-methyltransferase
MPNNYFNFKQFKINQAGSAFKVGTDGVLLGASAGLINVAKILDIGSGSGLISLMLAQRCNANITTIEPDYESYLQTCGNVNCSPWKERIIVINTDLQSFNNGDKKFDLIVTNPPYFTDSLKNPDPRKSAARHSDSLTSSEILEGTVRCLNEEGSLQLILPYVEGNLFIAEASKYGLYCNSIIKIRPLPTGEIRRLILTFSKIRKKPVESFLTIEHGKRHEFTEEYKELTKDFYLKF